MRLLWYKTTHTQTHPTQCLHFSNNFSKVFDCMVWICCISFVFIFIFLFKLYWKKKKKLLLLSLDNGRLCISVICIHKIKMKAEIFPVWDCYLVFVRVLWLLTLRLWKLCSSIFFENKAKQRSHNTLNLSVALIAMFKNTFVVDDSDCEKEHFGWILNGKTRYLINHATKYLHLYRLLGQNLLLSLNYFWNVWIAKGKLWTCGLQCSIYKRHFCLSGGFCSPVTGELPTDWQEGMTCRDMNMIGTMSAALWVPLCSKEEGVTEGCWLSQSWAECTSEFLTTSSGGAFVCTDIWHLIGQITMRFGSFSWPKASYKVYEKQ